MVLVVVLWALVLIPLEWGVYQTLTGVVALFMATSTARLLGAEMAHTTGTPAVRHFCRISKLLRPLTMTM
jgi:hypothetical protein